MRSRSRTLLRMSAGALAGLSLACAHEPTRASGAEQQQPEMVFATGSRIPQRVDPRTGLLATVSPVRVYSRQDLMKAGRAETADALRQLDPWVTIGPP